MAEAIIEKLDVLNEQAKILLDRRRKKNSLQSCIKKQTFITPLTFDFKLEFEEDIIATSAHLTVSKSREDKSHAIEKPKRYGSFKNESEPKKSDFEKLNLRPRCMPTKIQNKENKSIAQTEEKPKESFDLVSHLEDYVNKRKSPPQMNDFRRKENKSVRNDQLSEYCSEEKKGLLSLCFEDELKNPNAKIINISPVKTETSHMEQNDTNPIIFRETDHVQKLLLRKSRIPSQPMEKRNIYPHKRTNFVLERNYEILKSLNNNQLITSSKPKRTVRTAWRKGIQAVSFAVRHRVLEDKPKQQTTMQTPENISWNKLWNFSEPLSSLTKKVVAFLGKTVIQETSTKTGKFERRLSTVKKPMTKFSAPPVKYPLMPLKKVLKVHKLRDVTPLDDLLKFSSEN
ncbi:uncharacterized protein C1orf141 homolog [Molossus molossus]|uniref:uncharacterized protein C1orf141 homolog n=1 Tax=Molossus molossus TaxID=27622 RepID=UPI001745D672|nr:uncharacterized protein C1orf141 homolog [Molossus molossus]